MSRVPPGLILTFSVVMYLDLIEESGADAQNVTSKAGGAQERGCKG